MERLRRAVEMKVFDLSSPALACAVACAAILLAPASARAATITVNSTSDVAANDGVCTLREAIIAANTNTVSGGAVGECVAGAAGLDTIAFNIAGAGVKTITPALPLPAMTEPVFIDGYTQGVASMNTLAVGNNAVLLIELNGAGTTGTAIGINLGGGNSTVRGLVVNRFGTNVGAVLGSSGIRLGSDNNVISGNFIGSNAAGTAGLANFGYGVSIEAGANNLVGGTTPADRNLFAGDATELSPGSGAGILVQTAQPGTRIQGNYIGTNAAGSAPLGNGQGIFVIGSALTDITIGGLTPVPGTGAGNVISGNSSNGGINGDGVYIASRPGGGLTIQGNLIGLDATGATALWNGVSGINLISVTSGSSVLLIGGTAAGARNVIFNNRITGIVSTALGLTIQGNYIGTDITGTVLAPGATGFFGGGVGISLGGSATIGGASAGARNLISTKGTGVGIFGGSVTVQGNYFGTAADGVTPLGNQNNALRVDNDAVATIGGAGAGQGNVIAYSFDASIVVKNTAHATILGNSMFGNGTDSSSIRPPIDLNDDGVTANDPCDADTGPNNLQNFPVITAAPIAAGTVTISGTLNSTASTTFRVEFFSGTVCTRSGSGDGRTFLGFLNVTTDALCNAAFATPALAIPPGETVITATATDPGGNTSEFSVCLLSGGAPTPTPTVTPTTTPTVAPTTTTTPTVTPTPTPGGPAAAASNVPALSDAMLAFLGIALVGAALLLLRRAA
ncbi:MAG: CSLREA domain-containing protein [Thermoanaerobaculia bacterium]|nr:CSLREA domain-containing protein [Thermoanaerobaculia bacterium]